MTLPLSRRSGDLTPSLIREIADEGMGLPDVIALWFGESCWCAPDIAVEAATRALRDGDHFYQPNSGKPRLREAISRYYADIYALDVPADRITVSASGMNGLALVAQALVTPGDRIVSLVPSWPNIAEVFRISGAEVSEVSLAIRHGHWSLDLVDLLAAITPETKAVLLNSPNNPTGWTASSDDLKKILDRCRETGTWIVADDVYSRIYFGGRRAPSILDLAEPDDMVVSVNSFSKAWSMTGWRLGWIVAPSRLQGLFAMLTEFNIAGPPGFIQEAGIAMLDHGEDEVARLQTALAKARETTSARLRAMPGVTFAEASGGFYSLFRVDGVDDSLALAKVLMREARVGLAPGRAFGADGEGCLRLCFAQPTEVLTEAFDRLERFFTSAR